MNVGGVEVERTPLLIPSFSSKGFDRLDKIVEYNSEVIEGPVLFSAYDIHYGELKGLPLEASTIFLDSGGYEASKDAELSDYGEREHIQRKWTQELHESVITAWAPPSPATKTVMISYDHPNDRYDVREQVKRARGSFAKLTNVGREILLKPETKAQQFVQIEEITKHIHGLADFDVIGLTEKELGGSVLRRMTNIAKLRLALTAAGLETPIHVFGSLDTVTTPMYFLAGADIFDGLTWLRFAFHEGMTVYRYAHAALELGVETNRHMVDGRCWYNNYYYLRDLQAEMRRFLSDGDFDSFEYHSDKFKAALQSVLEDVGC